MTGRRAAPVSTTNGNGSHNGHDATNGQRLAQRAGDGRRRGDATDVSENGPDAAAPLPTSPSPSRVGVVASPPTADGAALLGNGNGAATATAAATA